MLKVKDVMARNIVFLSHEVPAKEAARILLETDADSIAVEDRGQILGIVTVRDFAKLHLQSSL